MKLKTEIEWLLYKWFGIKRKYPCGRKKGESYLCCCQPWIAERHYLTEDRKEWRCKVCDRCIIMSNHKMSENFDEVLFQKLGGFLKKYEKCKNCDRSKPG